MSVNSNETRIKFNSPIRNKCSIIDSKDRVLSKSEDIIKNKIDAFNNTYLRKYNLKNKYPKEVNSIIYEYLEYKKDNVMLDINLTLIENIENNTNMEVFIKEANEKYGKYFYYEEDSYLNYFLILNNIYFSLECNKFPKATECNKFPKTTNLAFKCLYRMAKAGFFINNEIDEDIVINYYYGDISITEKEEDIYN